MKGYVQWNMFYKRIILWKQGLKQRTENCRVCTSFLGQTSLFCCFCQLGLISDPQIFSKLQYGIVSVIYIYIYEKIWGIYI